jgi:diaminohydroxyphosphoribosylaminopyrimidine deaminase/5-amino-6-(5-phosphoribosylamino)uracil reductase
LQFLRARHWAILTAIDTVLTDDARLNVRLSAEELGIEGPVRQPVRVVLDSGQRLPPFAPIFDAVGDIWLYTRDVQQGIHHEGLSARGATLIAAPHDGAGLDLDFVLQDLAARGINEVLVEAGPKLIGALIDRARVDELVVYQAPILLGHQAQPSLALEALAQLDQAPRWHILESKSVGPDLRITLVPHPPTTQ